jgi:hypothetical protein
MWSRFQSVIATMERVIAHSRQGAIGCIFAQKADFTKKMQNINEKLTGGGG